MVPFAAILFISMIPVLLSVEYFTSGATKAAHKRAVTDGIFMGKLASAVECRSAVRVCNASSWVEDDLSPLLSKLKADHRNGFFRSILVQNWTEAASAVYMLLILFPLGLQVVDGRMGLDVFNAISTPLVTMIGRLVLQVWP